jgi:hypothetical protein
MGILNLYVTLETEPLHSIHGHTLRSLSFCVDECASP